MVFSPGPAAQQEMLKELGVGSADAFFEDVPRRYRIAALNLPAAEAELDVERRVSEILLGNQTVSRGRSFVGGTLKPHHVPAFVASLLNRQEFATAYTPYQAELSQGTLQALFEYQSLMAEILEMDVVNSSMYDVSTALGEAALMAHRVTGRSEVLVPVHLAPQKRATLQNYVRPHGMKIVEYGFDAASGASDLRSVTAALGERTAALVLENPNFFGAWETDARAMVDACHQNGALAVAGFDLSSLGIAAPPGDLGADIAVGDGTTFCTPPSMGGPQLGVFACSREHVRRMPGRLIGATRDANGNRAFCMTLQTREQHIRREKATSNICTNQSLLAVGAAANVAALGADGLRRLGVLNAESAGTLAASIEKHTPWRRAFTGPHYNEFTIAGPEPGEEVYERLGRMGTTPGFPASRAVAKLTNHLVVCSTEIHSKDDQSGLVTGLGGESR